MVIINEKWKLASLESIVAANKNVILCLVVIIIEIKES